MIAQGSVQDSTCITSPTTQKGICIYGVLEFSQNYYSSLAYIYAICMHYYYISSNKRKQHMYASDYNPYQFVKNTKLQPRAGHTGRENTKSLVVPYQYLLMWFQESSPPFSINLSTERPLFYCVLSPITNTQNLTRTQSQSTHKVGSFVSRTQIEKQSN